MNKKFSAGLLFVLFFLSFDVNFAKNFPPINLAGKWNFALDKNDIGINETWFNKNLTDTINLPGALQSQNYGDDVSTKTPWVLSLYDRSWFEREDYKNYTKTGQVKVPFLSQPPKHYLGAAWYQKEIEIPANWENKRIALFLERPHWGSTVWLNDKKIGSNLSLVAEHEYDLGVLKAGKHRISIRVDNRMLMDYRLDAHSVSDSLGGNWNGIVGKIELRATSQTWIDDAQIFTTKNAKDKNDWTATIKVKIGNSTNQKGNGKILTNGKEFPVSWNEKDGEAEIKLDFPNVKEWSEFAPNLYKINLQLTGENADDSKEISFGFREIKAVGNEFHLNNRVVYFRGNHHGGDFPLTGYPPTDVAYWKKIFQINKDWGINHVRFHSFCPPEAAFQAADEIGIYLQPEPGMWNVVSPDTPMEKMLYEETERMIKAYGNHPSFVLLSPSNEPKGRWKEAFDKWIAFYRQKDSRFLYTNGTGHTEREVPDLDKDTDYLAVQRIGPKMLRGNSAWFGRDYDKSLEGINIPVVSHELGQWVAYPDYEIIKKFTGYMRAGNYEIFRDSMHNKGLLHKNKDFSYASGRYQLECYKEEIEANLRTKGLQGFQLLDLHDYLGQGTALVGILDAFWEEKNYATAKEFRRFNGETVPLARLYKRAFKSDEKFEIAVEIAHFGEKPIENAVAYWKIITHFGSTIKEGEFRQSTIPIGKNIPLGKLNLETNDLRANVFYDTVDSNSKNTFVNSAFKFKLVVGIRGTEIENDWNFWVYPSKNIESKPKDVLITSSWTEAKASLAKGGKVLYSPKKANLDWTSPPLDTIPVFWTRYMNPAWARMLGLWIDKSHPALAGFPTENHFDWQWTELVRNVRAVNLDKLPKNLQPIVQPIDDWNRNYKLGLIFEAKVGKGKLLVSSLELENNLDERFTAQQLKKSLLDYMSGKRFNPQVAVSNEQIQSLFFDTRIMQKLGAKATATGDAANLIDGDPNTFWIAGDPKKDRQNQEFVINFPNATAINGLVLMPRQNEREHQGDIRDYAISISDDGKNWREIKRSALVSTFEPQTIQFNQNFSTKFLKMISLSGFGTDKTTALAEIAVIYTGEKLKDDDGDIEYQRNKAASPDIDEGNQDEKKPKKP